MADDANKNNNLDDDIRRAREALQRKQGRSGEDKQRKPLEEKDLNQIFRLDEDIVSDDLTLDDTARDDLDISDDTLIDAEFLSEDQSDAQPGSKEQEAAEKPQNNGKEPAVYEEISSEAGQGKDADIPDFDLAKDIMARQREITSKRRKPPAKKDLPKPLLLSDNLSGPGRDIIAQIVSRDIERLCRNNQHNLR